MNIGVVQANLSIEIRKDNRETLYPLIGAMYVYAEIIKPRGSRVN